MSTKKPPPFNFEKALAELNHIIEKMEHGNLSLEESLGDFDKGVALTRQCQAALQSAEQKVKILLEKNGEAVLSDAILSDDSQNLGQTSSPTSDEDE